MNRVRKSHVFLYARNKEDLLVLCFRDEVGAAIDEAFRTVRRGPLLDRVCTSSA